MISMYYLGATLNPKPAWYPFNMTPCSKHKSASIYNMGAWNPTHRPQSSSFLGFIFRILYEVIPKRNYFGAYG